MCRQVIIKDKDKWLCFKKPLEIIQADTIANTEEAVKKAFEYSQQDKYSVGFVKYEAAKAFDDSLRTKHETNSNLPLAWFAIFEDYSLINIEEYSNNPILSELNWQIDTPYQDYRNHISEIKKQIALGNTYQVNYTLRLKSDFNISPLSFFASTASQSDAGYCCFVETDEFAICSFSPELFFKYDKGKIITKPIKGTIARGRSLEADLGAKQELRKSEKDMAENVMIVDMLRNDLGTIAIPGSVEVPKLFELETYPTLHQMSSTITAQTNENAFEVFKHLFPCASITGAPKCRTMEIISALETSPRDVYTGSIGYFAPSEKAVFNVAIRTVEIDKTTDSATYGVGGGIVWDSTAENEYNECLTKTKVLNQRTEDFELLESLLWSSDSGFYLLELHLSRISKSAEYFGFKYDQKKITDRLEEAARSLDKNTYKIRLLLAKDGAITVESQAVNIDSSTVKLAISKEPVSSSNLYLYHKNHMQKYLSKGFQTKRGL